MVYRILILLDNQGRLITHANVDYARDRNTHRSTRGIIYKIGEAPIAATSRLQLIVSRSTTEVEYCVTSDAMSNVKYLRRLMIDLGISIKEPTSIYREN